MKTDEIVTNCNALKPVRCGCGGEAIRKHYCYSYGDDDQYYFVWCERCDIQTKTYPTEAEAIEAWNRAMRRAKVDILPNTCEDKGEMPFCPHCGDELEWE